MNQQLSALELKGPVSLRGKEGSVVLDELRTNEIFIGMVGPAGAGVGTAAQILNSFFKEDGYQSEIIKVSALIRRVSISRSLNVPAEGERKSLEGAMLMQDRGDDIRKGEAFGLVEDYSAVARLALSEISKVRAKLQGLDPETARAVTPDGKRRAFIIDSLRHPSEVALLREIYKDSFLLVGVVCDPAKREKRVRENLFDRSRWSAQDVKSLVGDFLTRDEDSKDKHGQHVADTFYEADFFVDNSKEAGDDLTATGMNDQLRRLVSLVTKDRIIRPTIAETAMHHARSAQMRSACLSRQVGAAIVDVASNIVATGTNDVPKAGGGLYGESFISDLSHDHRCAFRETVYCSSNKEQNTIIEELLNTFPEMLANKEKDSVVAAVRKTRLGGLIEFSRAVHAEMDAILSAAISGASTRGSRMYVTTYPCHYCARHIVAAGIDEVQFIEPYPKSKATQLHNDSITTESTDWKPPSQGGELVLFRPFVGVSPRFYKNSFLKDRDYKNKVSGDYKMGEPIWGRSIEVYKKPYFAIEDDMALEISHE